MFSSLVRRVQRILWTVTAGIRLLKIEVGSLNRHNLNFLFGKANRGARFFNLDLHVAVAGDLESHLTKADAKLVRFSISDHNHLVPNRPPVADPVAYVNQRKWRRLSPKRVRGFQGRYGPFLRSFDGFVVTHTPSFVELFTNLNKPVLCVVSTRYESPYTERRDDWNRLNRLLTCGVEDSRLRVVANNQADADYFQFFAGASIPVVPSLCAKETPWTGSSMRRVVACKDPRLSKSISAATGYEEIKNLGLPYAWTDLAGCAEVFVIPQNVSTMLLFELATAGVPVAIPSPELLKELRLDYEVLNELTFAEMSQVRITEDLQSPVNWESPYYLDWWLDRADFYNKKIMPNVRVVQTLDELKVSDHKILTRQLSFRGQVVERNRRIEESWREVIEDFVGSAM